MDYFQFVTTLPMMNRSELPLVFEFDFHRQLWKSAHPVRVDQWTSPTGRYLMHYEIRRTSSISIEEIGCCRIVDSQTGRLVARLLRDNHTAPQCVWLHKPSGPTLIWASTYLHGYEIINFATHTLVHVDETDGHHFIWTGCALSPDENRLVVTGCHWACPYEWRVFDVSADPPLFPLREVASFPLVGSNVKWIDNETVGEFQDEAECLRHHLGPFMPLKTARTWQAWDDNEHGTTFVPSERVPLLREAGLLGDQAVLRHTITAATGEQAMLQHFMLMGWPPYSPQGEKIACPNSCGAEYYPDGYGDCPNCGHIG